MRSYSGKGLGDFYYQIIRDLVKEGRRVVVRGQECMEFSEPVILEYKDPGSCFMLIPKRRFNPFFALAEVYWILSGSSSARWISYYNKQMLAGLDHPEHNRLHGAYGNRFRYWPHYSDNFSLDQIEKVCEKLKRDPTSRQAIISIWNPARDNEYHRDIPCVAGETIIWSPEGNYTIKKLAKRFKRGKISRWPVFTVNPLSGKLTLDWATDVWKSGTKKLIKLSFDDGSSLKLTGNHVLYKRIRGLQSSIETVEVRADALKIGDSVWATRKWYTPKGHEWLKKNLNKNTGFGNRQTIHRMYSEFLYGELPEGWDVHHKNGIKTDNRKRNLVRLDHGEHASLKMFGDQNPMNNLTEKQHKIRVLRWRKSHSKNMALKKEVVNHKIIDIEYLPPEDVFDFTTKKNHNALVGNGILIHNCNNWVGYTLRDGILDQTVVIRSNDLIWGTPYNAVQFTHLQALIAGNLEVSMGKFTYVINNLHFYYDLYKETLANILDVSYQDDSSGPGALKIPNFCTTTELEFKTLERNIDYIYDRWDDLSWIPLPEVKFQGSGYWNQVIPTVIWIHRILKESKPSSACEDFLVDKILMLGNPLTALITDFLIDSQNISWSRIGKKCKTRVVQERGIPA